MITSKMLEIANDQTSLLSATRLAMRERKSGENEEGESIED